MRQQKSTIVALSMFLALVSVTFRSTAQSEPQVISVCPPGVLTVTLDAPPEGMANVATIRLDEHCRPVQERIRTMPIGELPSVALDGQIQTTIFEPDDIIAEPLGTRPKRIYQAEQAVFDIAGATLTKVHTRVKFKYSGFQVLRYNASGVTYSHTDIPPICGSGWYLAQHVAGRVAGDVGSPSVSFVQSGEFGYRGHFDCSGNIYYNKLSNHVTVYGSGVATCQFTQHYRTWSLLWHWAMACY